MRAIPALLSALPLLAIGCASVPLRDDFSQVRSLVEERTGETIEWAGVTAERDAMQTRVDEILSRSLDADAAVQVALLNQPRLQADLATLGIAAAERVQAGLPGNPFLDLAFKFNDGQGPASIELDLVGEILDLFLLPARKRIAAVEWERARLTLAGRVIDLASETRRQFYTLQAEEQILDLDRAVLLAMEAQYETSVRLRRAGNISQLDLMTARDLYEQTKLRISMREQSVYALRESLTGLMGLWGSRTDWEIERDLPELPPYEESLAELETLAVANSLDLRASMLALEQIARQRRITNITAILPELEAGIAAEREVERHDGRTVKEWWYGPAIGVEIPLFDQGQPRRTIARMELMRQWSNVENQAIMLRSAARTSAANVLHAHQQAAYVSEVVLPLKMLITQEAQLHFNGMFIGLFQLLDAKRREIETATLYIERLRDYWIARETLTQIRAGRLPGTETLRSMGRLEGNRLVSTGAPEEGH